MIYKIYTFQYEANKFLYGLGKGHQQYIPHFHYQNRFQFSFIDYMTFVLIKVLGFRYKLVVQWYIRGHALTQTPTQSEQ